MRPLRSRFLVVLTIAALLVPIQALPQSYEVRREIREGVRSVAREKREAVRELRRCTTRECARREIREGYREVNRERREARREIRREIREDIRDQYWRDGRYYRDGRYWEQDEYVRRYYGTAGDDRFLEGIAVGAAVIGVTSVIVHSRDD